MILLPFETQKLHPQSYQKPQSPGSGCNDGVLFFWNFKFSTILVNVSKIYPCVLICFDTRLCEGLFGLILGFDP